MARFAFPEIPSRATAKSVWKCFQGVQRSQTRRISNRTFLSPRQPSLPVTKRIRIQSLSTHAYVSFPQSKSYFNSWSTATPNATSKSCIARLALFDATDDVFLSHPTIRPFSTSKDDETKDESPADKNKGLNRKAGEKLSLSKPLDPEFQRFLTGDSPQEPRPRRRRYRLPDPDKELFARIQKKQLMQKEASRHKTAQNVYRALIGNMVICGAKLGAWISSGSSGMLAEFIHSVVDCGNQALLLIGLRDSRLSPDRKHPYGYGKSVYFWALVSALGTFFLGAGVSMTHAIGDVLSPSLHDITWHVWGVLLFSLAVDGYVFGKTISELNESKPKGVSLYRHMMNLRDPATLAILLEDGAACLGVVLALSGIVATHATGNPIFDGLAGVGISALLGGMGIVLVRVNHRFLLGQSVDKEIVDDINKILMSRRSIDSIGSVQSQWTGPDTFSYKAEVDFDGTYLAATLMKFYQQEFLRIKDTMDNELQVLLAFYSEDVMRTVEREIRKSEALIRQKYPGAEYIELEPMSVDVDRLAIDDNLEAELRRMEGEALDHFLRSIRAESSSTAEPSKTTTTSTTTTTVATDEKGGESGSDSSKKD